MKCWACTQLVTMRKQDLAEVIGPHFATTTASRPCEGSWTSPRPQPVTLDAKAYFAERNKREPKP